MTQDFPILYRGQGEKTLDAWSSIRPVDPSSLTDPSQYKAPPDLVDAVNVALDLGMPLLLTGEPGCGKSELASSIAWELDFPLLPGHKKPGGGSEPKPEPLRFTVKSDTQSNELFYRFDTLGRFHKREDGGSDPKEFITYEALGKAILYALGKQNLSAAFGERCLSLMRKSDWDELPEQPLRSVVLIDEIDKAPREVPNDILNEIERLSFKIPELFERFPGELGIGGNHAYRPVIIITSNDERPLPKAFLRRCVYYHLQPPPYRGADFSIESIVNSRLGERFDRSLRVEDRQRLLEESIGFYEYLRESRQLEKPPAVAELLAWVYFLSRQKTENGGPPDKHHSLFQSSAQTTLLKLSKDQAKGLELMKSWLGK